MPAFYNVTHLKLKGSSFICLKYPKNGRRNKNEMTERIMEESKTKKRTTKFSLFFFVLLVVVKIKKITNI